MLRILLADDHEIVRRGLKELLEEQAGWTVCAEAANGREAVELAVQSRPHVAILGVGNDEVGWLVLAGTDGGELLVEGFLGHLFFGIWRNVDVGGVPPGAGRRVPRTGA